MAKLTFLGAAGTVTGSRHLLETHGKRLLIDCGLFQGIKANRLKNWDAFPEAPPLIDEVILTHAHIDHTGYLPRLVKDGFRGGIHCTSGTADLLKILLPDTGHLQEEEARYANKKGYSKHHPAKPLFTEEDAKDVFPYLRTVDYGQHFHPAEGLRAKYRDAGHILGSAWLDLKTKSRNGFRKIVFSGDLGRPLDSILRAPVQSYDVDYLVLESTYGDRLHEDKDPREKFAEIVTQTMDRHGMVVIPAFSVGRTQTLLFMIREMEDQGLLPSVPIYVDSPMALKALEVHKNHIPDFNLTCRKLHIAGTQLFRPKKLKLCPKRDQSIAINNTHEKGIIISASGMATGGRILHHLKERLPKENNTILFVGYQAEGTRGRTLLEGAKELKMFGEMIPVNAHIEYIPGFSGHADYQEILAWLLGFNKKPERIFLVHGEDGPREALANHIRKQFNWNVTVPKEGESVELDF
ncbi:MAG: MBL fold metallo-hydrolase [Verrucomicrobia bacterium]|nr:MBL fold metallo-hydrolase [Verrucomicrobiota bacterium]MDA1068445.1 MBL fold metallo-hydrolase [Verrucomicrobiota bacterium]